MTLRINGHVVEQPDGPATTLLSVIRDQLGLKGTKQSCGRGECGACTVLVDGVPTMSCITFAVLVEGDVTTIEGMDRPSADLRQAFAEFGGFQCGFCTAGQVVHAAALLDELAPQPELNDEALERVIRHRLSGNICRCTGYRGIVQAVMTTYRRRRADVRLEQAA